MLRKYQTRAYMEDTRSKKLIRRISPRAGRSIIVEEYARKMWRKYSVRKCNVRKQKIGREDARSMQKKFKDKHELKILEPYTGYIMKYV